jgi:hypothetical protein
MPDRERFLPSRHGFAFSNSWPSAPAVMIDTHFGRIAIGNAAAGLCGGMVFVVLDYWNGRVVPPTTRPAAGQPLYRQIVRRLIDSWDLPAGVAHYYECMILPDGDRGVGLLGRRIVLDRAWPPARSGRSGRGSKPISTGASRPPLGVVTVASSKPADLGLNHQVLAYAYDRTGTEVSLRVYDPNRGQRDDVRIRFDETGATGPAFTHNLDISHPVRGFFRTEYTQVPPAADPSATTVVGDTAPPRPTSAD